MKGREKMQVSFETDQTVLTAKISGELDHHVAKELREKIDLKLAGGIYNTLIFDFDNLSFMDSSGIAVIMGRVENLKALSGSVKLKLSDERIKKMLSISGVTEYVEFI